MVFGGGQAQDRSGTENCELQLQKNAIRYLTTGTWEENAIRYLTNYNCKRMRSEI